MAVNWTEEEYKAYIEKRNIGKKKPVSPARKKSAPAADVLEPLAPPKQPKGNKYHAERVWVDGILFDSKKEADYYCQLKLLARSKEIAGFAHHGNMVCNEGVGQEVRATLYETDFIIFNADGTYRVVDTKGMQDKVFKLKAKMLKTRYPKVKVETL